MSVSSELLVSKLEPIEEEDDEDEDEDIEEREDNDETRKGRIGLDFRVY
jgi:hypothetical protein